MRTNSLDADGDLDGDDRCNGGVHIARHMDRASIQRRR